MTLPSEVMTASRRLENEGEAAGRLRIGIQALVLFFFGLVAELVVARLINIKHMQHTERAAGVETELQAARFQFMGGVVPAIVHGVATLVPLLVFDWPPIIEICTVISLGSGGGIGIDGVTHAAIASMPSHVATRRMEPTGCYEQSPVQPSVAKFQAVRAWICQRGWRSATVSRPHPSAF